VTASTTCGSASDSVVVSVAAPPDTTPPTAPTSLTASSGKKRVALSWGASTDDVGVTGYLVFRSTSTAGPFAQVATTTGTSYTNTGLVSRTTYYFQLKARDAAGNLSDASNTASATPR
jgi:chitodextrinase